MRKNLFFFSIIALVLLLTTGCYIDYSDGSKDSNGNPVINTIGNKVYKGEYVEKTEFGEYSAYVTVYVSKGMIKEVVLDTDKSKVATSPADWDTRPDDYYYDRGVYLRSFKDKTVDEIKTYNHETADDKLDKISGATITSDRILKAVQNALSKI